MKDSEIVSLSFPDSEKSILEWLRNEAKNRDMSVSALVRYIVKRYIRMISEREKRLEAQ